MSGESMHFPASEIKHVLSSYKKGQVDYASHFLWLYISYSSWYQRAIGTNNDRQALNELKKRFVIWDDYTNGRVLRQLRPYMERLSELTQREPFPASHMFWKGEFSSPDDWRSLIEFWYQVRCLIVHGTSVQAKYVWFAYETLDLFMAEIIDRMSRCFTDKDMERLDELRLLARVPSGREATFKVLQAKLHQKYINSPNIWQVDMQRVGDGAG